MGNTCYTRRRIIAPSLKTNTLSNNTFIENFASSPFKQAKPKSIQYKKGDIVGKGACGQVYRCLNLDSGEFLAAKTIQLSDNEKILVREVQKLKQEIKILKSLSHENIVKYYGLEINEDSKEVDILLEYISGGSLKDALFQYGKMSEKITARYACQILTALIYLHSQGIIHRDLKGANILVDINGTIKLTDFSTSKKDIDGLVSKSLKGTPHWMAPEIVLRLGHGPKADIWSLGCVIIELLTTIPPFYRPNQTVEDVIRIIASEKIPEYPKNISEECKEFLDFCLQRNPDKRLRADELINLPFIIKNCQNFKYFSTKNLEDSNKMHHKAISLIEIPQEFKQNGFNKAKSQEDIAIFQSVRKKTNTNNKIVNFDEKIIDTAVSRQMRSERQEELEETRKFNEERKKQWDKALSGKF